MTHELTFPSAVPELLADRIRLRDLTESDIPAWYARATDAESADLAGDPIPASIEEGRAWLQRHRDRFRARTAIRWSIVRDAENESIGTVGLTIVSPEQRVGELSIVIGRAHWRQGIATSAARVALNYGLGSLGLRCIRAEVLQRNVASVHLLEKVGFRRVRAVSAAESTDGEALFHYTVRAADGMAT